MYFLNSVEKKNHFSSSPFAELLVQSNKGLAGAVQYCMKCFPVWFLGTALVRSVQFPCDVTCNHLNVPLSNSS